MPEYSKGKIYKITGGGLTYIGSTTQTLASRFAKHRSNKKHYPGKNITSYPLLDFDDCCITLIEDVPCERKEQLHMRERYHIENTECVNKIIPLRTQKEWRDLNKEHLAQYFKIHYEKNKEHKDQQSKIYIANKKEQCRSYWEKNKEKINQQRKEKYALKKLQKETLLM